MALRIIEISLPDDDCARLADQLDEMDVLWHIRQQLGEGQSHIRILSKAERTQPILDLIQEDFVSTEKIRCIVMPVEASLPAEEIDEEKEKEKKKTIGKAHISREELLLDVEDGAKLNRVFLAMVLLSAVVAAIGVLKASTAVVIGAMVIAPLLGPNVALSLAANLADRKLALSAVKVLAFGIGLSLAVALIIGLLIDVDPSSPEIASRTTVDIFDLVLALASGAAGVLAYTSGVSSVLVGVMVAVALLPPLVTAGMLIGAGQFQPGLAAALLFLTNMICINLAGVVVFRIQGIGPLSWWEEANAKKASHYSILALLALVLLLAGAIVASHQI